MTDHPVLSTRAAKAQALALAVMGSADATSALDLLVHLAVTKIGADGGQISMLTDRQVSLCVQGAFAEFTPAGAEHPFEETMCSYALRSDDTVVIPDTRADQRVAGIEAVAAGHVGAYLGVPIRTADMSLVGVLCVFSRTARTWTGTDQDDMHELAGHVAEELERRASAPVAVRV